MRQTLSLEKMDAHKERYFLNRRRWNRSRLKTDLEMRTASFKKDDAVVVDTVAGVGTVTRIDQKTHTVYVRHGDRRSFGYNAAIVKRYAST